MTQTEGESASRHPCVVSRPLRHSLAERESTQTNEAGQVPRKREMSLGCRRSRAGLRRARESGAARAAVPPVRATRLGLSSDRSVALRCPLSLRDPSMPLSAAPDGCAHVQASWSLSSVTPGRDCSMPTRPAPGRRIRPSSMPPDSSSRRPARVVGHDKPVASDTSASPPYPITCDFVASHVRRPHSSRSASTTAYFSTIAGSSSVSRLSGGVVHETRRMASCFRTPPSNSTPEVTLYRQSSFGVRKAPDEPMDSFA